MTAKLLKTYKQKIQALELVPSGGGCFELSVGEKKVYSKLETGQFPEEDKLVAEVGGLLG